MIVTTLPAHADQFAKHNNAGNKLVEQKQYEQALNEYQAARVERPEEPGVAYNLGNLYHDIGVFDTAAAAYQKALSSPSRDLAPEALYNLGNTHYRMDDYQAAADSYKRALIADPDDLDAKHNLELALRMLQQKDSSQQQQKQKQDQNQPDSSQQDQSKKQQQQPDSSSQQQQQQNQDQPQNSDKEQQPQDQQDQQQNPRQQRPQKQQGMTREDAMRLLDALKNDELELQKRRLKRLVRTENVAKDW